MKLHVTGSKGLTGVLKWSAPAYFWPRYYSPMYWNGLSPKWMQRGSRRRRLRRERSTGRCPKPTGRRAIISIPPNCDRVSG
eukprot:2318291-Rhodomonas_salina.1